MGFDQKGEYLVVVSHSGRGVYKVADWSRVARDPKLSYPENGVVIGLGPLSGECIRVSERSENAEEITVLSPCGKHRAVGTSSDVTIFAVT